MAELALLNGTSEIVDQRIDRKIQDMGIQFSIVDGVLHIDLDDQGCESVYTEGLFKEDPECFQTIFNELLKQVIIEYEIKLVKNDCNYDELEHMGLYFEEKLIAAAELDGDLSQN